MKIIYLIDNFFNKRLYQRFEISYLLTKGYDIEIWSLKFLLNQKYINYFFSNNLDKIDVYDNLANPKQALIEYKIHLTKKIKKKYDVLILAVPHKSIIKMGLKKIKSFLKDKSIFLDLKNSFPNEKNSMSL